MTLAQGRRRLPPAEKRGPEVPLEVLHGVRVLELCGTYAPFSLRRLEARAALSPSPGAGLGLGLGLESEEPQIQSDNLNWKQ